MHHPKEIHIVPDQKTGQLRNELISRNFMLFLDSVSVDKDGVDQDIKVIKLDRNKLNHQVYYFLMQNYVKKILS